jgi:hypothetical protein
MAIIAMGARSDELSSWADTGEHTAQSSSRRRVQVELRDPDFMVTDKCCKEIN